MIKFTCPTCDADNWLDLDYLRSKQLGFCICKDCGFETYHPAKREYKDEEEVLDFYRYEYRRHPGPDNIVTCNRKLGYIQSFMKGYFMQRDGKKLKKRKFLDIGCATGYFPAFLKAIGHPDEDVYGTEYTVRFANFAKNYYNIKNISEEPPKGVKFDYIHLIHVLEHMHHPDKKLLHYREILKDDGYLMIGIPVYHNYLFDTAKRVTNSFEDLFHPNHVNVWTLTGFKNLLAKTGWKIVREDRRLYGYMCLLKKTEPYSVMKEDYKDIVNITENSKLALANCSKRNYKEAHNIYPKFPDALLGKIFFDNKDDYNKQLDLLNWGVNNIPEIIDMRIHRANMLWQWRKYDKALEDCMFVNKLRPNDDLIVEMIARIFAEKKMFKQSGEYFRRCMILNPIRWASNMDMVGNVYSRDWTKPHVEIIDPSQKSNAIKNPTLVKYS